MEAEDGREGRPSVGFAVIRRYGTGRGCDGPFDGGGDCKLNAVVTVHGEGVPPRNLCSHCFLEFVFGHGRCDAKVAIVP